MSAVYHITVKGHLDSQWSAWFDNMTITHEANGEAVLRGPLADQSALYGVLAKVRDLGLPLAVVKGDQIVHLKGFGVAGPDGQAVTPQPPYMIGSLSKSMTAWAV